MKKTFLLLLASITILFASCSHNRYALHEIKTDSVYELPLAEQGAIEKHNEINAVTKSEGSEGKTIKNKQENKSFALKSVNRLPNKSRNYFNKETKQRIALSIKSSVQELKKPHNTVAVNVDGEVRKSITLMLLGIAIMIFGAILNAIVLFGLGWLIYLIGSIVFLVGLILLILYLVDHL